MLYYHKCADCLTAFSSTEPQIDECDCACTEIIFMGQVKGDKYVKTENRSPCDGRCTEACGPHCDCVCGGANHGTGRLVATVVKEGKIKAIDFSEEDMLRAYKYRKLRDYAQNLITDNNYSYYVQRELDKIVGMRTYDPRLQALVNFIVKYKKRN